MNNYKKGIAYLLLLCVVFFNCEEKETIVPSTVILEVKNLNTGGVEVLVDLQNITEEQQVKYTLGGVGLGPNTTEDFITNPTVGTNTILLRSNFQQDQLYYISIAVLEDENIVTSSRRFYFYALTGSYIAPIKNITPLKAFLGDIITIELSEKVENLIKEGFEVKFNGIESFVEEVKDGQKILCKVPNYNSIHIANSIPTAEISVSYLGKTLYCDYSFVFKKPEVTSVSPKIITWNDEITIKGNFYKEGCNPDRVAVVIDDRSFFSNNFYDSSIVSVTHIEIKIKTPSFLDTNFPNIRVNSNGVISDDFFDSYQYIPPKITSVKKLDDDNSLEILGNYFLPSSGNVTNVFFDDEEVTTNRITGDKIVVYFDKSKYVNKRVAIRIEIADFLISNSFEYQFQKIIRGI